MNSLKLVTLFVLFYFQVLTLVAATTVTNGVLEEEKKVLENILTELYHTAGIYHVEIGKPSLLLSEASTIKIAAYFPRENQIIISTKVIAFAQTKNDSTKKNIYLNVIGHELGHYFQKVNAFHDKGLTNLSLCHRDSAAEVTADFYSVFTSMLAGHNVIKNEVDEIISSLYDLFDLKDELDCYPTKSFRQTVASRAISKADSLYQLFQFANYLTAAEEYQGAIEIYDYLLLFYKGAEFYNNRGILYFLKGLKENYGVDGRYKRYFYPIEMDLESKLASIKNDGAFLENLDTIDFSLAIANFREAAGNGNNQEKYHLNIACCIVAQGYDSLAIQLLEQQCFGDGDMEFMLKAIIKGRRGKDGEAAAISEFDRISNKSEGDMQLLAKVNLAIANAESYAVPIDNEILNNMIPDLSSYPNRFELKNISVIPLSENSTYQYGWDTIKGKGKCFVLKKDSSIELFAQESSADLQPISPAEYLPSSMGLNFRSYYLSAPYGKLQLIMLSNGKVIRLR